ncbi:MAG TPA: D-TA family PLP-dependent enzyme [Planctomycetaceae bacterium]|nr:D-TA family PLP-dependent enzyme [Planctomycetaceae bacterium]
MTQSLPIIESSTLESLLSPSMVIFRERLQANLDSMLVMAGHPNRLRPHCKTHKMDRIIRLWVEQGVTKHKAATIAECEMLAAAGATDVLLAYNPVGPNINRVVALATKFSTCRFSVTTDHEKPLQQLSAAAAKANVTIGVMLDVNVGMDRTGITPDHPSAVPLYTQTSKLPGLRPAGFHVYDGHLRQMSLNERMAAVAAQWPGVMELREKCAAAGVAVPALACGGTPTFPCYAEMDDPAIELCPGTCVLHDAGYGTHFPDLPFEPAAAIVTRVISRAGNDRLTLDIGNKAVAADPPKGSRIFLPELPDAVQAIHNEEHMVLITPDAERYEPGDVLLAIPMHVCPTSALYDRVAIIEKGQFVEFWEVTARNRKITI